MAREQRRWRIASRSPLRWRGWNGEWVVFNPESGDTHLLDPIVAESLRILEVAPAGASELLARLTDKALGFGGEDALKRVEELLAILDESGLIEPADDPV